MSRIAKNSIKIDQDTSCKFQDGNFFAKGKLGEMNLLVNPLYTLDIKDNESLNTYKRFYIKYPLEILSSFKGQNIKFFYPSTVYINKIKSTYSKIKKNAELKLKRINKKNITINLLRIDEVNTKQNISLSNKDLPSFIQLINKNKHYQNKIFFIKWLLY